MIKMEYRWIDKSTIHAHAEMYGKFYDIVDEIAAFLEDVYDKDPKTNPDAVKYDTVPMSEVLAKDLKVMDSTAASMCRDNHMPMLVFDLSQPDNIRKAVLGENVGTVVVVD